MSEYSKRYSPKPLIEEHYHIQELIDRQEKRSTDRTENRNKEQEREEREKYIQDSEETCMKEFWCNVCNEDFLDVVHRQIEQDWSNPSQSIAFYKTKCGVCDNWCIRHITDRNRDPYWFESQKVAFDRGLYANALIQEWETGYQLLYGRKNT